MLQCRFKLVQIDVTCDGPVLCHFSCDPEQGQPENPMFVPEPGKQLSILLLHQEAILQMKNGRHYYFDIRECP